VKIVVFDEAARRISPGTSSMRGSRLEEGWHDRERQRHDQDPRLRPTTPEYTGSVVGETAATGSSGTNDAELLGAAPPRPSEIAAEAGGSPSSEAPLDHAPRQGFGRVGRHGSPLHRPKLVERVIRESNDPRGTRHVGRLQTLVFERIFPSGAKQAARPRAPAQGQLDVAVPC
jgi:hypothetical protein